MSMDVDSKEIESVPIFRGPIEKLRSMVDSCDGISISKNVFDEMGVFVCRGIIDRSICDDALARLIKYGHIENERDTYNAVSVEVAANSYQALWNSERLLDELERILGHNIALYGFRFVVKDARNNLPVFLHNDICYHKGGFLRVSAFVALTPCTISNGGMEFFPGTHHFGYLGDAGELDVLSLQPGWPVLSPSLDVGDVVVMHSAVWHRSSHNVAGQLRVLADMHFQPSSDPTGLAVVRGEWNTQYKAEHERIERAFVRSRVSRLVELEHQMKSLRDA
jgi:hypothetical protein